MSKLSAPAARSKSGGRGDVAVRRSGTLSDQARVALTLVVVFASAFVSVIGLKIFQERRDLVSSVELSQARAAAFLAERTAARLARVQVVAVNAATTIEIGGPSRAEDLLAALAAQPLVRDIALLSADGDVIAASSGAARERLPRALQSRGNAPIWDAAIGDAEPGLFTYAPAALDGGGDVIVAEIDAGAATPAVAERQTLVLAGADGRILAAGGGGGGGASSPLAGTPIGDVFAVNPGDVAEARRRAGGALILPRREDGDRRVLGVAPIAGADLTVMLAGPLKIDEQLWRNTLVFYVLLLVAPILVSVGLCAVLLMQMENIRQARAALQDQERRFRLAIEGARCGVWDWNLGDDTVFVTDSLAQMFNLKGGAQTMKGAQFLALVRPQDQEKLAHALRSAPTTGEVDVEFRAHSVPVWLQARGRPWTGTGEAPSGRVVGVAIDVTEQKGAQARVNAAETRLRAALESVSECFVLWDARRRLVLSNQKYREFFNLDAKLVKPGASYDMLELAAKAAIKRAHTSVEDGAQELELADGRWIHFSERRTADDGLVSIGTDITALKNQESQLIEREKQAQKMVADLQHSQQRIADLARRYEQEKIRAQEANRSKSEFLANMSHELRTPLNAINGFSDIMVQEMFGPLGDERYKEYANDILASGQLLLALINDILDMSKIEAGKMKLGLEELQPDVIADQCVRLVRGRAQDAELELSTDVGDMPAIKADPRAVKQILLNLLTNAIKFTPERGRVVLEGRGRSDGVRFRVIDTGIGISEEDLSRIGKPFEQIESQQSKSHQGSGLGLALSRSLAELHGGELIIESALGKGTIVTVHLPLDPETRVRDADDGEPDDVTLEEDAQTLETSVG